LSIFSKGPNAWPGAREAMLTVQDRIDAPLLTNKSKIRTGKKSAGLIQLKKLNFFHFIIIGAALLVAFALVTSTLLVTRFV